MRCPRCSGVAGGMGVRTVAALRIQDGAIVRRPAEAPRLSCRSCGHVFVDRSGLGEAFVLDRVVDEVSRSSVGETARRMRCDERTVGRCVSRWAELREDEIRDVRPEILTIGAARVGGADRILVCDGDDLSVLDVLPGVDGLSPWMRDRPGRTSLSLVPLDPRLAAAARGILPDVPLAVAPSQAARAVVLHASRALAEASSAGRNFRERPELLDRIDAELSDEDRVEIEEFWTPRTRTLRRRVVAVVDGLSGGREGFLEATDALLAHLSSASIGASLRALLTTWRDAFAEGAGQRWLDAIAWRVEALCSAVAARMGRVSTEVLRIVLVMSGEGRLADGGRAMDSVIAIADGWPGAITPPSAAKA